MPDVRLSLYRLLFLDCLTLRQGLALTFARWSDRLLLALLVGVAVFVSPPNLSHCPRSAVTLGTSAVGASAGWRFARLLLNRLERQGAAGIIASSSLHPNVTAPYTLFWLTFASGIVAGTAVWLAVQPALALAGFAIGSLFAWLRTLRPPGMVSTGRAGRASVLEWQLRVVGTPSVGLATGIAVVALTWLGLSLANWTSGQGRVVAASALGTAVALLTPVENSVVRFEAMAGRTVAATLRSRLSAALAATLASVVGLVLIAGPSAAILPALLATLVLAVQSLRVLLHRAHSERAAEWLATGTLTAGAILAMAAPPLLLIAGPLTAHRLWRSAERARWRLMA